MNAELVNHRLMSLERAIAIAEEKHVKLHEKLDARVKVLEIAHAKLMAVAMAGAFLGGLAVQLLQMLL